MVSEFLFFFLLQLACRLIYITLFIFIYTHAHTHIFVFLELQLARLQELGFSMDDCRKALLVCQGNLNKAFHASVVCLE